MQTILKTDGTGLFTSERVTMRGAVEQAMNNGVRLHEANLAGADLQDGSYPGVSFRGADLRGAKLAGALLDDADLREAKLGGVKFAPSSQHHGYFTTSLSRADLTGADLGDLLDDVPFVPDLDLRMERVTEPENALDMFEYHRCETTHCRAGWAIHLAGEAGYALEDRVGPGIAGALIYLKSTGRRVIPDFHASHEDAREDIVDCACGAKAKKAGVP